MADLIKTLRPWDRQPHEVSDLNLRNPIAASITTLIPFGFDNRDIITGKSITIGSGGSIQQDGRGLSLKGSGSAAAASIALNLSAYSKISVSFWLYWDAYANDYDLAMEFSAATGGGIGEFYLAPNYSGGTSWEVALWGSGVASACRFARPSAAAWHHYVVNFEFGVVGGVSSIFVDGASVTITNAVNTPTGTFANATLNILHRSGSLYGAGRMQNLAIRGGYTMSAAEALEEYLRPWELYAPRRVLVPVAAAAVGGGFFARAYYDMIGQSRIGS